MIDLDPLARLSRIVKVLEGNLDWAPRKYGDGVRYVVEILKEQIPEAFND